MQSSAAHPASFRDPSGFIFSHEGIIYRQVNKAYSNDYDVLMKSGLYNELTSKGLMVAHDEVQLSGQNDGVYKILKPENISLVSYPWEWSFAILKDAALLTLRIARLALNYGMVLKDATAFNIQQQQGRLVFIDSLSFTKYDETQPWIGYRQYCEWFLGPLLLMHYRKLQMPTLFLAFPEGVPLKNTSALLPWRSKFSLHTYLHIHLHAKLSAKQTSPVNNKTQFSRKKMENLLSSLEQLTASLQLPVSKSTWSHYYDEAATREDYLEEKKKIIVQWLGNLTGIKTAIDCGTNTGAFSDLLVEKDISAIATDFDPYCIDILYTRNKAKHKNVTPLVIDFANPSPPIGYLNNERASFLQRTQTDLGLALAFIHHLAIGKNIPLLKLAELFSLICSKLIIEFVPKDDIKVQQMLAGRDDIFGDYSLENFKSAFEMFYIIEQEQPIPGSGRILYLMKRK